MPRNLANWIRAYSEYTSETESPECFHFWAGLTLLGAATIRQTFLNFNYFTIHPNFYTILVGPSGARKSIAAGIAIKIASSAGIKKFSDKITGAALIKDLSESTVKVAGGTNQNSQFQFLSPMLIYASELGVFLGPDAYGSGVIADLTDLYDCPIKWEKKTVGRGSEEIIAPFVSVLAASTPQTLKDVIPPGAVGQGFTSRILFVWGAKRRQRIPLPKWSNGHQMLENQLINDLKHIGQLTGEFQFTADGLKTFQKHYLSRLEPEEEFEDERLRGYSSRKDTHLLKIAMALSLADRDDLTIDTKEIEASIDALNWLDSGLASVFSSHGTASTSQDVVRIYEQVKKACRGGGHITQAELFKRNFAHSNYDQVSMTLKTLTESGAILEVILRDKNQNPFKAYRVLDYDFIKEGKVSTPTKLRLNEREED